jgi:hypothetical protein
MTGASVTRPSYDSGRVMWEAATRTAARRGGPFSAECRGTARRRTVVLIGLAALALALTPAAQAASTPGQVQVGAAVVDGTYHVGSSAGQYASTRDGGYGDVDPNAQEVKNKASYGIQSRESVRAIVIRGAGGNYVAMVSDDHYIPQDALWRRTAQLLDADTGGRINERNLTMTVTHNHSSPSYSSFDWGVWTFQDVFDFRFFDYYARQNARAVEQALAHLHDARVSATASRFDAFQRNPMGPGWADDGTPDGFPRPYTDHDLSVVRFENVDDPNHPQPLATLVNIGQHPEMLEGYDLISGEWPATMERMVDRTSGGITVLTQNATGTSEVERDNWHPVHDRDLFDHVQYNQMEWGARQLADAVIGDVRAIDAGQPNPDDSPLPYGGTSYHDRFVPWMTSFPVAMDDRWFPGPISHPYPGVSSCRTDPALQGDPRLPVVGLPDCEEVPAGDSLMPVISQLGLLSFPGISTDTFEQLGIPLPENYSAPSTIGLEDTLGVHMQAFRLGDILLTVCSCEQWVEQSYNIKTRTDQTPGNEYLGYDPTSPSADASERCTKNGDGIYRDDGLGTGTWACTRRDPTPTSPEDRRTLSDSLIEHMRAQILNDASRWDDPTCLELGCGLQAESEPTDLTKVRGNFTHDDTTVRGGHDQSSDYASRYGYRMTVTISMANDYNGYIASYREFMDHDHYRKALTGWGPHSSDYYATRLSQMGHALKADPASRQAIDAQTDPAKLDPAWAPLVTKETADQKVEEGKVAAVGQASSAAVKAYDASLPNDGGSDSEITQPKDIERFDAATFTWDGGNNYTDDPNVVVQRRVGDSWVPFSDQSGEVPVILKYPYSSEDAYDPEAIASGLLGYRLGGQTWKWTASFEAFVSRFPLVDPQGDRYSATPPGTYRFAVHGVWRRNGANAPYSRVSRPFEVRPWSGITVNGLALDSGRHVRFSAGPAHKIAEQTVRRTDRPPIQPGNPPIDFTIGPVDFPDAAKDEAATGARFLDSLRGYSGTSTDNVEHYCLDCSFRPWLDSTGTARTGALTATVTFRRGGRRIATERVTSTGGAFRTQRRLAPGESADVVIRDRWGDRSGTPAAVRRAR